MFRTAFTRCPLDGDPLDVCSGDPLAGREFADRYVIEECIGEGAMGRVYRARHRRVSRQFAIKVLFGDHASDAKMRSRFAREAEAASRLNHENVISVIDFGETDEQLLYLVMDFVEGPTLSDLMVDEAPMARDRVANLVRQLCKGLAHAHSRGLIHRDFKGENVIVTRDSDGTELARIVDFGIAMMLEERKSHKLTTEGMVLGTPAVMSPEQATGDKVDLRTDLFALGVVMYEMLAGVLPFDGSPMQIARQNLMDSPPRIAKRVPGLAVDSSLEDICHWLMSKRAADRPTDAKVVIAHLDDLSGSAMSRISSATPHEILTAGREVTPLPYGQHSPYDSTPQPYDPNRSYESMPAQDLTPPTYDPTPGGQQGWDGSQSQPEYAPTDSAYSHPYAPTPAAATVSMPERKTWRRWSVIAASIGVVAAVLAAVAVAITSAQDDAAGEVDRQPVAAASGASDDGDEAQPKPIPEQEPAAPTATAQTSGAAPAVAAPTPGSSESVDPTAPVVTPGVADSEPTPPKPVTPPSSAKETAKDGRGGERRERKSSRDRAREPKKLPPRERVEAAAPPADAVKTGVAAPPADKQDVSAADVNALWRDVGALANRLPIGDPRTEKLQLRYLTLSGQRQAMLKTPADRLAYQKSLLALKRQIQKVPKK